MTMDDLKAEQWEGEFEPIKGLPQSSNLLEDDERPLYPMDQKYQEIYDALDAAEKEQSPEKYAQGIRDLIGFMKGEITQRHRGGLGDLDNTMNEWANKSPYPNDEIMEKLKKGLNVVGRTNTMNNSYSSTASPHGTGLYRGDPTDRNNSQYFGNNVVDYVNARGKDYITAQIVPGQPVQQEPVSVYQVETTLKGFQPRIQAE